MSSEIIETNEKNLIVSEMAENLIGSEIIRLAWQINERIAKGQEIYNMTIGDFDPKIFPIPEELTEEIKKAYSEHHTNYPPANGSIELRKVISNFLKTKGGLDYGIDEIIITSGARPIIYAAFNTIVDNDDVIIFPVPSWNNNHYTHLSRARAITIETSPENNFMPTAADIEPHIGKATLIALCSPLNPTGTVFTENEVKDICDLIVNENNRRGENEKPVYLLFDQIYWLLTLGETKHFNPVLINPEMRNYTIFVDGLSKAFCGTGVRVGWGYGPKRIIEKMKSITSHMGAWAPKAEQVAISRYLGNETIVDSFVDNFKNEILKRLNSLYKGLMKLKEDGYRVDAIVPQAAIYMTVKFDLIGSIKEDGSVLETIEDITEFLICEAKLALVPFSSFGSSSDSTWYRISVGTCTLDQIDEIMKNLRYALSKLS
ncbi:MAG TPA: aminotransferase class I/II-fold pyridoxal phosphate-dependent enzyme [Ignavibacteria bacterium]|nr:aminotransferase class I/II-fold pyridoxal phosphate-dependent enzyme [Ignavibacteria bacterium]